MVPTPRLRLRFALGLCVLYACRGSAQQQNDADDALKAGQYAEAEKLYRVQLQRRRSADLLTNLGITLNFEGRLPEAIASFKEAERLRPTQQTYALLTQDLCRTGDLASTGPMLDRIAHTDTTDTKILAMVAPCYLDAGRPTEAVTAYRALAKTTEYPPDLALTQLAHAYAAVAAQFGGRLHSIPGADVYLIALEHARSGSKADARSAFETAARRSPNFNAGSSFGETYALWQRHPEDAALNYQMVVLAGEGLIDSIQRCSVMFPDSVYLQQFQAEILADQGREDDAITLLEDLHRSHPELADPRFRLGMLYRGHGDWEKAAGMFRQQAAVDPHDEAAAARLSEALVQLGRFAELKAVDEPRLSQQHPPMWTFLDLAMAEQKLGNVTRSIEVLQAAEKADPDNRTVHYRLMRLFAQRGDTAASNREKLLYQRAGP